MILLMSAMQSKLCHLHHVCQAKVKSTTKNGQSKQIN